MARRKTVYRPGNRGLAYLRVSTRRQLKTEFRKEGISIPTQRNKCDERAAEMDRVIVGELIDPGYSATTIDKRKSYKEIVEWVTQDESISFVMVYQTSRMNRNWEEEAILSMTLRNLGVRYLSATEDIDDEVADKRAMHGFLAVMNDWQSDKGGTDIFEKMGEKAKIGGTPGFVPLGYDNITVKYEGHNVNTVKLDKKRAPLITEAFEWWITGKYTLRELVERLTDAGLTARANEARPARPINEEMLKRILRNRYYLGYVSWGGNEHRGRHKALVDQDTFDRAQKLLDALPNTGSRERRYHHYLKGMLWCAKCDSRLIVMRGKSRNGNLYFYYFCRGRQQGFCKLPYMQVTGLEQAVLEHYGTLKVEGSLRQQLHNLFDDTSLVANLDDQNHRERLVKRLSELERQEDRYIDLALDPDWPREKLTAKLRAIRDERARVRGVLEDTEVRLEKGRAVVRGVLSYLDRPLELYAAAGTRARQKLNKLIFGKLKVDADEDGNPYVADDEVNEPFATLVYLRRDVTPVSWGTQHKGDVPKRDVTFENFTIADLRSAIFEPKGHLGSSKACLVGDTGIEPVTPTVSR